MITNHGPFRDRLAQLKIVDDPHCECGERDTSLHLLLSCKKFKHLKIEFEQITQKPLVIGNLSTIWNSKLYRALIQEMMSLIIQLIEE